MSRLKSRFFLPTCLLVAALVLIGASTLWARPASNQAAKTMTWKLTGGQVVSPGTTTTAADGTTITTGYVVQAVAQAQGRAKVATGKFTINCSIQEKGGAYQVRGAWDITREGAAKAAHHTPDSIKGTLVADSASWPGAINGQAQVGPMRRHADKQAKAVGTFKGDKDFNGTLTITRSR
jgi:hypothetical protein